MNLLLVPVTVLSLVAGFYLLSKIVQATVKDTTAMMGEIVREILQPPNRDTPTVIHTDQEEMFEPAWANWPTE